MEKYEKSTEWISYVATGDNRSLITNLRAGHVWPLLKCSVWTKKQQNKNQKQSKENDNNNSDRVLNAVWFGTIQFRPQQHVLSNLTVIPSITYHHIGLFPHLWKEEVGSMTS